MVQARPVSDWVGLGWLALGSLLRGKADVPVLVDDEVPAVVPVEGHVDHAVRDLEPLCNVVLDHRYRQGFG